MSMQNIPRKKQLLYTKTQQAWRSCLVFPARVSDPTDPPPSFEIRAGMKEKDTGTRSVRLCWSKWTDATALETQPSVSAPPRNQNRPRGDRKKKCTQTFWCIHKQTFYSTLKGAAISRGTRVKTLLFYEPADLYAAAFAAFGQGGSFVANLRRFVAKRSFPSPPLSQQQSFILNTI